MSFLERLLQGVQGKAQAEQQLKVQALANEEAKRAASESFAETWLREKQTKLLTRAELGRKELERYSVRGRIEAIRDGIWKVGKIETIHEVTRLTLGDGKGGTLAGPVEEPIAQGFYLLYSYPAPVPIGTFYTERRQHNSPGAGYDYYDARVPIVNGYREGRRFDALVINIRMGDYDSGHIFAEAVSRCPNRITGNEVDRYSTLDSKCEVLYEGEHRLYEPHPTTPGGGFQEREREITSPDDLERFLIDYSYRLIQDSRLPLQSETEMQSRLISGRRRGIIRE